MSTGRRKSTRTNNWGNAQEQQKVNNEAKRRASLLNVGDGPLAHSVLEESQAGSILQCYEKYAAGSPLVKQRDTEEAAPGGRATRKRTAALRSAGGAVDDGTDGLGSLEGSQEEAGDAAARATIAAANAKSWEDEGHHVLDLLEPLMAHDVTMPKALQEALQHLVLDAEAHTTPLATRAAALLDRVLEAHPPARMSGGVLVSNANLWDPVSCPWMQPPLRDLPRFSRTLRQGPGLLALAASAHNMLASAVGTAMRQPLPVLACAPAKGDAGDVLLLKYWARILQADAEVRLAAAERSGWNRSAWEGQLRNSLIYRCLETFSGWSDGDVSRPSLIRTLATASLLGHLAASLRIDLTSSPHAPAAAAAAAAARSAAAAAPAAAANASGSAGGAAAGPVAGAAAAAGAGWSPLSALCGPGEVGALCGGLLGCLLRVLAALDRMGAFQRGGAAHGWKNDAVQADLVLGQMLYEKGLYREPEHVMVLLHSLPPASSVRLLSSLLGIAAAKRSEGDDALPPSVRAVADHYGAFTEQGVMRPPPQVRASDALRFLLDLRPGEGSSDGEAGAGSTLTTTTGRQRQRSGGSGGSGSGGGGTWAWVASSFRLNSLPHKAGLGLLVTGLAVAGLRQAEAEQRAAAEEEEDWAGAAEAEWGAEAEAVAGLYQRAAERLAAEKGGGAGGVAGVEGGVVGLAARCAERMAARVLRGAGPAGRGA
ncbi:hypothetical protein HYH03_007470 [Edaphochlamys debaryana]|uniref:Uncharacterized protein n=1 Tax=Edaphochlamys debaryana TaxID=47281 RepID=A0A835Y1W8_9CHLO|nr:hypothetical protein HYH03_007470 [Edaphochlamys debaryana]|eukprot:KAG2494418.1 hypothetical protein HYH03_007470 [Edaphochlamys debaryana]